MSAEDFPERHQIQTRDLTFIFPNETPQEEVFGMMQRIVSFVYEDAYLDKNKISEFGTVWIAEVTMIGEKIQKKVEEMTEEELGLEMLRQQYLQDEF